MHKSKISAVFLATILFTGALTVSLPSFIGDAEATEANDKSDITHKDKSRDKSKTNDKDHEEEYDYKKSSNGYDVDSNKYPNEKKEYNVNYDKYSAYGQDNVDLQCDGCIKYSLDVLNKGQVSNFVNILSKYINFINWGGGVDCTILGAPENPPDNKLGVECLPIAASNTKKQDLAQTPELGQQLALTIPYIAERDNTDVATAFETFATGFEVVISRSCVNEGGAQLCKIAEGLLDCLEERVVSLPEQDITHNVNNKNVLSSQLEQKQSHKQKQQQEQQQQINPFTAPPDQQTTSSDPRASKAISQAQVQAQLEAQQQAHNNNNNDLAICDKLKSFSNVISDTWIDKKITDEQVMYLGQQVKELMVKAGCNN